MPQSLSATVNGERNPEIVSNDEAGFAIRASPTTFPAHTLSRRVQKVQVVGWGRESEQGKENVQLHATRGTGWLHISPSSPASANLERSRELW